MWFIDENTLHLFDINEHVRLSCNANQLINELLWLWLWFAETKKDVECFRQRRVDDNVLNAAAMPTIHVAKRYRVLFALSIRVIGRCEAIYCMWHCGNEKCVKTYRFFFCVVLFRSRLEQKEILIR